MDKRNKKLLDSIIEYLNPRFNKIENEISSLKSDVATINKYISTESKVKEITANKLVEDKKKWTPLVWVACKGYLDATRFLI